MLNPQTKYKRSKHVFAITSVALIIARNWPQWLQSLAQSLVGVPSLPGARHGKRGVLVRRPEIADAEDT